MFSGVQFRCAYFMSAYPEHLFGVNIKVLMGDDVSETDCSLPVDFGIL